MSEASAMYSAEHKYQEPPTKKPLHNYGTHPSEQYTSSSLDQRAPYFSQLRIQEVQSGLAPNDDSLPPTYAELPPQDVQDISRTLQWIPSASQARNHYALPQLVAIPQVEPATLLSGPMPWTRAYAPILAHWDISPEAFVAFIDNLTIAAAPSPPVQAVQLVGAGIGFVPHHWAQLASGGIGLAAGASSAAISITRTKLYLKEVNQRYFNPRGLTVTVLSDEELEKKLASNYTHAAAYSNQLQLATIDPRRNCISLSERRLAALEGRIAQLTYQVPVPNVEGKNMIDRLSGKQVQMKIDRTRKKSLKQIEKQQRREQDDKKQRKEQGKKDNKRDSDDLKRARKLKWIVVESLTGSA